jgi:hypothetical protein
MVRLPADAFSAMMVTIREWLERHRYEPASFIYDQHEDAAVVVSVDFMLEAAAQAFAARFDGVYHSST